MATSNLLPSRSEYSKHYGAFRGVDFSSDHTQVSEQRLAYLVNMYKDYQSGQGVGVETIPGFRRRFVYPNKGSTPKIHGIHHFHFRGTEGETSEKVLVHADNFLYLWNNYPNDSNLPLTKRVYISKITSCRGTFPVSDIEVFDVSKINGEPVEGWYVEGQVLNVWDSTFTESDATIEISYLEPAQQLSYWMNNRRSTSFVFNNRLYILDGRNYLYYDGQEIHNVTDEAFVPTTHIDIAPTGSEVEYRGAEYEQRNLLSDHFKNTFTNIKFDSEYQNTAMLELNELVKENDIINVYADDSDRPLTKGDKGSGDYYVNTDNVDAAGQVFPSIWIKQTDRTENAKKITVVATKPITSVSGIPKVPDASLLIRQCTIATVFDGRVFLSGNPMCPNHIFYSERHDGYVDPSYFGVLDVQACGIEDGAPIIGMIPLTNALAVLKGDTQQDGSVYYLTPQDGSNVQPRIYPSTQGLNGVGCLGACVNFLDDPVFVSRLGVEAIGQLSVRNERAIEHRSSLIDAKLRNLNLKDATFAEWNGYLVLLVDGKIFLADSRQRFAHESGVMQYEWYYLEDIGVWEGQYTEYRYSRIMPEDLEGRTVSVCPQCGKGIRACECDPGGRPDSKSTNIRLAVSDWRGEIANPPDNGASSSTEVFEDSITIDRGENQIEIPVFFTVRKCYDEDGKLSGYEALLCEPTGATTGGSFYPARTLAVIEDNLFFGTTNGVVCSFNFDMRGEDGAILPRYYAFDGRTIVSGCATKMDNCGVPHLNKNTVKKSTVIKTRTLTSSVVKIKVRTNRKPYEQIARINSALFSFENMDFADFSFLTAESGIFAVREKEKKWIEKQYYIYSDEFAKPFSLFSVSFRYQISGRYKE